MPVYMRVRTYLEEKNLDVANVAEMAGINPVHFEEMMGGIRPMYAEDIRAICLALDVSANIFMA